VKFRGMKDIVIMFDPSKLVVLYCAQLTSGVIRWPGCICLTIA
jgi:hypothetical protein